MLEQGGGWVRGRQFMLPSWLTGLILHPLHRSREQEACPSLVSVAVSDKQSRQASSLLCSREWLEPPLASTVSAAEASQPLNTIPCLLSASDGIRGSLKSS